MNGQRLAAKAAGLAVIWGTMMATPPDSNAMAFWSIAADCYCTNHGPPPQHGMGGTCAWPSAAEAQAAADSYCSTHNGIKFQIGPNSC
jgi:hypothetical protein